MRLLSKPIPVGEFDAKINSAPAYKPSAGGKFIGADL